jgi:transposase
MRHQHSIEDQQKGEKEPPQGILVPLDLPGCKIMSQSQQDDGSLEVHVIARKEQEICPSCQTLCRKLHDTRRRVKRDIALRGYQVRLVLYTRRFRCTACRRTFTEAESVCGKYKRTTKRFRQYLAQQASAPPVAQIAAQEQVGPRFVQDCLMAQGEEQLAKVGRTLNETAPLPTPRFLGIDEFARRKGHRYDTILCDLVSRTVLEVSEGRTLEDVQKLLKRLDNPAAVEAVSMDMSASFRPAVQLTLPQAVIVVDHFHVIQHLMKAFRKIVSSWAHKKEGMILLHRKQHLFLRAQEDLTAEQAQERAAIGIRLPELEAAWKLKEALRFWYAHATTETAATDLDRWIQQVQESGFVPLQKTLSAFSKWRKEILAFFQFRISNGFVEGKNNRTKTLMRQGYGYRNRQHLRLRILSGKAS